MDMMIFSEEDIRKLALEHYGLAVTVAALNGYDEQNYLLRDGLGNGYIFKVADESHGLHFIKAQVCIVNHLKKSPVSGYFQQYFLNTDAREITSLVVNGNEYYLRVLSYLEGGFWVNHTNKNNLLLEDLGRFVGNMDRALAGFSHPAMHRHYTWDISTTMDAAQKLQYITDHERRRIAGYFILQFETLVLPQLSLLRKAYIHNDANDYNVLVKGDAVTGLIDFGDMVYSALINNVAVACTYAMFGQRDPIAAACLVVKGYHGAYALTAQELDLLYYLIAGRLCISVTQSAYNASLQSSNEHHFITEDHAWQLLHALLRTNPLQAQHQFRLACGLQGVINDDDYLPLLQSRRQHIGRNLSISYNQPLKIVKSALQYLYDDKGRVYVDCVNNPSHVGHCHPTVVKRMQTQIATLNTNTRYLNDLMMQYAERLTATLPPTLQVCYFVNSGSEANDLAIRMARCYTRQNDVIVLDHAYHGTSTLTMQLSPYKFDGKGGAGKMPWVHKAISPDLYRGPFVYGDAEAGAKYAADVERIISTLAQQGLSPAAFICESLLGVGGQQPLPAGYLHAVYQAVRAAGGVCIADEVQVGFGRVGETFWGFELQGVTPDMVVVGKPIGNGHPLAAVVVTQVIADAFNNGMEYFNTFGGNPVSMATGLAVLDVIQAEEMQQHALQVGNHLMAGLRTLMAQFPIVSDVRGHGLFIGAELVKDRRTKEPALPEIDMIVGAMKDRGYLLSTDGPLHNVLKIKPPMPFNKVNADELCHHLREVLLGMGMG